MKKEEIWKDVVGHEGVYMVSNLGRLKTMGRTIFNKDGTIHYILKEAYKKLKTKNGDVGYYITKLRKNGKYESWLVHRLVAISFIPNPENKPFINHKNGNKLDNVYSNLEWCTKSENEKHAYKYLGKTSYFKDRVGKEHPDQYQ